MRLTFSSIRPVSLALGAASLVVMAGCGSDTPTPSGAASSSASSSSAGAKASAPSGPATIEVATTKFGKVLADDQGRILYMFDKDKDGTSDCYDKCEAAWPPVLTTGDPVAGTGGDKALLGTSARKDGTTQVTYNKLPIYRYTPDAKPGDVNGQAVGGVWWVVSPEGSPLKPATVSLGSTTLGDVLTDSADVTLYMFDKDKGGTSSCYGECATNWPPLLTTGAPKADAGTDGALLGTTKRTDGTEQVTYNKLPLYYFAKDKAPKDVNGQAVGKVWWVMSAKGTPIKK